MYHKPVLLENSLKGLAIKPNGVYVDVTFGGGGHSRAILERLGPGGKLIAFDQDQDAIANQWQDDRFLLIHQNFKYLKQYLKFYRIGLVDGVLADLGISSYQIDTPERGFSTRFDAPLDMRMNQKSELNAQYIVSSYSMAELSELFYSYGELRNARKIAQAIIDKRQVSPINTTSDLNQSLRTLLPLGRENKVLAQVYQALRMEVNQELKVLESFLVQTKEVLIKGGRLSVISYHSLEDRWVKRYMQNGCFESQPHRDEFGRTDLPFKKMGSIQVPDPLEIKQNSRARSAKLRVAERL